MNFQILSLVSISGSCFKHLVLQFEFWETVVDTNIF